MTGADPEFIHRRGGILVKCYLNKSYYKQYLIFSYFINILLNRLSSCMLKPDNPIASYRATAAFKIVFV